MKHYPNASPSWCGNSIGNIMPASLSYNNYDGTIWYSIKVPFSRGIIIWHNQPLSEEMLSGNICYTTQGNIWICDSDEEPPELIAGPVTATQSNIHPSLSVTSVKMENHPEHIAVMFGQVISNLK